MNDRIRRVLAGEENFYDMNVGNLGGPDLTPKEADLALKLAELHARCMLRAGETPAPDPMRALLHLAQSMAAIVLHEHGGGDGHGAPRH